MDTTTATITLDQALAQYRAEVFTARNFAPRTREEYARDLADLVRFLTERAGLRTVDALHLRHLEGYLAELDRRGLKGSSRRRKVAAIRSFCRFLTHWGYLAANPADRLIPPHREYEQPRVLTEAEYQRLQLAVAHEVRDAAIVELLLQTGLRLSEAARLTLSDVTLPGKISKEASGSAQIRGKGRRERTISLNWKACKALKSYLAVRPKGAADPHLFLTKFGAGMGPRAIQLLIEKHLRAAQIAGASVHTLRHTFATHHVKKGTSLKVVQDMLGHASLATTSIYVGLARELMDKQMQENAL